MRRCCVRYAQLQHTGSRVTSQLGPGQGQHRPFPNTDPTATNDSAPWSTTSDDGQRTTNPRHLLRALLRECTYLPDRNARQYLSQHVISRFRTYEGKALKASTGTEVGKRAFTSRLGEKLKHGRRALSLLHRANQGELKPLLKVLYTTYGRIGKRKHDLLAPLLIEPAHGHATTSTHGIEHDESGKQISRETKKKKSPLAPALYALALSQKKSNVPEHVTRNPRNLSPTLPELNSKKRLMPASRVKNLSKKWYADLLHRILPPLPKQEWLELRDWVNGHSIPMPPTRRNAPKGMQLMAEPNTNALDMVVTRGSKWPNPKVFGNPLARNVNQRALRRMYSLVFRQCPVMEFDSQSNDWVVSWFKDPVDESSSQEEPILNVAQPVQNRSSVTAQENQAVRHELQED